MAGSFEAMATALDDMPDPAQLQRIAGQLCAKAEAFQDRVADAAGKWSALADLYSAPEGTTVFAAMNKPSANAVTITESAGHINTALHGLAADITGLERERDLLKAEIQVAAAFEASVAAGTTEGDKTTRDNDRKWLDTRRADLQSQMDALVARYKEARASCARRIDSVEGTNDSIVDVNYQGINTTVGTPEDTWEAYQAAIAPNATEADRQAYYDELAGMGPDMIEEYVRLHPEVLTAVGPAGAGAAMQNAFWSSLRQSQKDALMTHMPGLVGNTEGVPYDSRNQANLRVLDVVLADDWPKTDEQRRSYESIKASMDANRDAPANEQRTLISFNPADRPLAAIALGDLDASQNTTFVAQGMDSSTENMQDGVRGAENILREQRKYGAYGQDQAVIAWVGYDSPGKETVGMTEHAETGGTALAAALDGYYLTQTGAGNNPQAGLVAHSYGCTTGAFALTETEYPINSVVFVGPAGIANDTAPTADVLNVEPAANGEPGVYVTKADRDNWAGGGGISSVIVDHVMPGHGQLRVDAWQDSWGAQVFASEESTMGGEDLAATSGHGLLGHYVPPPPGFTEEEAAEYVMGQVWALQETEQGTGYFDPGTTSLRRIAMASAGRAPGIW